MTSTETRELGHHVDKRLRRNLDIIKKRIIDHDKDYVIIIDGQEGSGKSTLAIQIGKYVDPDFCLERICFTGDAFKKAIIKAQKGQCVVYDEAITGLASSRALSKINNMLKSLMMQMRQKNLFVIVVIPTIFALEQYVALFRARALIHTYEPSGRMGYFKVYNRKWKRLLVLQGRKTFDYTRFNPPFRGRFYGKFALGKEVEAQYRKMKADIMEQAEDEGIYDRASEIKRRYDVLIHNEFTKNVKKQHELYDKYKIKQSERNIYRSLEKDPTTYGV